MRELPYNSDELTWIDQEHTRNAENVYCYCGKDLDRDEPSIQCQDCRQIFHGHCIRCLPKPLLFGDNFLQFHCDVCTSGAESYERENMSWVAVVHLVLYNLIRRREIANKQIQHPTVDHKYFRWKDDICAFVDDYWDYLVPKRKRSPTWHNTIASVLSTHGSIFKSGIELFHQTAWWTLHTEEPPNKGKQEKATSSRRSQKRDRKKNDGDERPPSKRSRSDIKETKQRTLQQAKIRKEHQSPVSKPLTLSAESKAVKGPENSEVEDEFLGYGSLSDLSDTEDLPADVGLLDVQLEPNDDGKIIADQALNVNDDALKEEPHADGVLDVKKEPLEEKFAGIGMAITETVPERLTQQEEWQIHQKLFNSSKSLPHAAKRLERKLALRRSKRSFGLRLFDFDYAINQHLKQKDGTHAIVPTTSNADEVSSKAIASETEKKTTFTGIFTPYVCSFASRLYGSPRNGATITKDEPWLSAWNGRKLRPYIRRDFKSRPPMMQILQQIVSRRTMDTQQYFSAASIDYVYFQPEHLPQVNSMLRRCFWEGIDVSESLLFPEYSIVALYKRVIVGCAFMTPEAYITYIAVLPGWENAGIGQFMLYHLFQTAISKDITLHVSANNRAMLLYQKFGFKPEEFIVNFYDKYLPAESLSSKNAFFLRLRR